MVEPQKNEQGQIAIRYYQTVPHVVSAGKTEYAFVVQHNICLAWINPEHVNTVLAMKHRCCGDNYNQAYFICNDLNVKLWKDGRR